MKNLKRNTMKKILLQEKDRLVDLVIIIVIPIMERKYKTLITNNEIKIH